MSETAAPGGPSGRHKQATLGLKRANANPPEQPVSTTSFNTENLTYRQLLGNGLTYQIPCFQHDYSWG